MSKRLIRDHDELVAWRERLATINRLPSTVANMRTSAEASTGFHDMKEDVNTRVYEAIKQYARSYQLDHIMAGYRGLDRRRKHLRALTAEVHVRPQASVEYLRKLKEFEETQTVVTARAVEAIKDILTIKR